MDTVIGVFWDLLPGLIVAILMAHYNKKQKKIQQEIIEKNRVKEALAAEKAREAEAAQAEEPKAEDAE